MINYSHTWDKKVPRKEVFLLFLFGTAHDCLVLPFVLLLSYVSNYDVIMQSATFPATSEGCLDVKENIIGIFLFKMNVSLRHKKNNQVPVLNPDRPISVLGDTMTYPSLGYRLDWYLWHCITLDWDLSVWIQHWDLILLIKLIYSLSLLLLMSHGSISVIWWWLHMILTWLIYVQATAWICEVWATTIHKKIFVTNPCPGNPKKKILCIFLCF